MKCKFKNNLTNVIDKNSSFHKYILIGKKKDLEYRGSIQRDHINQSMQGWGQKDPVISSQP